MTSEYTRTGIRRSGDDYQDLVALDLIIEMLEHPTRYQWIRVEADEAGFLDDVVALRTDDTYVVRQVKFSAHPDRDDDNWSWETLLTQREGKKKKLLPSLLEKWISSFEKLNGQKPVHEASLVSNRRADATIRAVLLPDRLIDFDKLDDSVRQNIFQQIGDENRARNFFSNFRFDIDRPKLEHLENSLRKRFYRLGGEDKGWLNLKDELRSWVRNRNQPPPNGAITLPVIKSAALWYQLQSLPQNFEVPEDYVLPSVDFHELFVQERLVLQNGCVVLTASPGVGKSTYLSYLFQHLIEQKIPVIRHHYFLSLSDRTIGRLDHTRVAESLMSDIQKKFSEALGETAKDNPHFSKLGEWLSACGRYFVEQGKHLVIIIDGLDHVWRDQQSVYELDKLFEYLLPTSSGIVVVVGTQPVDDAQLPSRLKREAPRESWYELPFLDFNAVENWISKHANEFHLPETEHQYSYFAKQLVVAFFRKSQGHPLHLRYTLKTLQEQNIPVTVENIEHLPGCPHQDITVYYKELWNRLSSEGHMILRLFAACKFAWPPSGIIECCSPQALNFSQINDALRQTKHLMIQDSLGLRPFHSSLLVFVAGESDYEMYSLSIRQLALNWIKTKAPGYWKWAYEWLLEADLGNEQSLLDGPNRQWVIEAIVKGYPYVEVTEILTRSAWISLQKGDLPRYVEVALLCDYYSDAISLNRLDIIDSLLYTQLFLEDDSHLRARLHISINSLTEAKLVLLAENEFIRNNQSIVHACVEELNTRLKTNNIRGKSNWETILKATSQSVALDEKIELERVVSFSLKNIKNVSIDLTLKAYTNNLKNLGIMPPLRHLFKMDIPLNEKSFIFKYAVLLSFEQNTDLSQDMSILSNTKNSFIAIYAALRRVENFEFKGIEFPDINLISIHETQKFESRYTIGELFLNLFFCFLANYLFHLGQYNKNWLIQVGDYTWPRQFIHRLDYIAEQLADFLDTGEIPSYSWLYEQVNDIEKPRWPEEREVHGYGVSAEQALTTISLDILALLKGLKKDFRITQADLENALSCDYCQPWNCWLDTYLDCKRQWLSQEATKWFLKEQANQLAQLIEQFDERATKYAKLAALSTLHGLRNEAQFFIQQAASNLLSYGEHKDILLRHILDIIESCHKAGIPETKQWLLNIAPLIAEVENFTDGDETRSLLSGIANTMAEVSPELLLIYYQWLCSKEENYDALSVFHTFLKTTELSSESSQALAKTALDEDSLLIFNSRAEDGDEGAQVVLKFILRFLGNSALDKAKYRKSRKSQSYSSSYNNFENKPLPLPEEFPPASLKHYWDAVRKADAFSIEGINPWINFWKNTDQAEDALLAIEAEVRLGTDFKTYDEVFTLALAVYGKDYAYPWLIKAHISHYGWRYYYGKEDAVKRWKIVKEVYPERWFDFILNTFKAPYGNPWREVSVHGILVRLVDYCIFIGETELAKRIAEQSISSVLELVSPLSLPIPEWINEA